MKKYSLMNRGRKLFLLTLITTFSVSSFAASNGTTVIYGDDNRVDVMDSADNLFIELSQSTAAMVSKYDIIPNGEVSNIRGRALSSRGICQSERFATQPTAALCSGFLVGPKTLVTAGHCITSSSSCESYNWVFDYKMSTADQTAISVPGTSVYSCKRIINRKLSRSDMDDWAIIELDREVTDRRPLSYRTEGQIEVGTPLVVIGHPSGLPTKIADGAKVKALRGKFFTANLDTYGGNSGSAVFNAETGLIEGILVRGAKDYTYDYAQGCNVSNVLGQDEGRGEDVTFIGNIPELEKSQK